MASREDKAAAAIQATMKGKNARATGKGAEAAAAASAAGAAAGGSKKSKEAAKQAAERQRLAEQTFVEADEDGSGYVDETELSALLSTMLTKQSIKFDKGALDQFVKKEFAVADIDGNGQVDFDEFVTYYNSFIDRIEKNLLAEAMKEAEKAAAAKEEEKAAAEDGEMYQNLITLLSLFRNPSIKSYTGINIPYTTIREARSDGSSVLPDPAWGCTSRGIILDLSRQAQRILTPWGGLSLGYRLAFPGYQEKAPPAADDAKKKSKANTQWPHVPANAAEGEDHPLFFELTKYSRAILTLIKLPNRCHFRVRVLNGKELSKGEVMAIAQADKRAKLTERYQAVLKKFTKDPPHGLPDETQPTEQPLINQTTDRCIAPKADKFDLLKKRKEVFGSRTKYLDEDLERALLLGENDVDKAVKCLQGMKRAEDNLVSKRGGHATRAQVRYALQTCSFEESDAEYMLVHEKEITRSLSFISERLGTETGLGYPTTAELQMLLVKAQLNEGNVMAGLKKKNRLDCDMMADIIAAAEVEEMLTPERCDAFGFSRQPSAAEQKHVEDAYLYKFNRNADAVVNFFVQVGTVIRRSLGTPERWEVEGLLDEFGKVEGKMEWQADPVISFLQALQNMVDVASKKGHPSREDCARYLRAYLNSEENAMKFMESIHKMSNPKPPKPPPKGSKKPPQPHLAAQCGFPSRSEAEWALKATRDENKEGKPLNIDKALELLGRLHSFNEERVADETKFGDVGRPDIVWALDPDRTDRFIKARPLTHEEYSTGASPTSLLLVQIGALTAVAKTIAGSPSGSISSETRHEIWDAIEKFKFDKELAQKYITGVKTLMTRQAELNIESREEVDAMMKEQEYDETKVLELMKNMSEVQKVAGEVGYPSRTEIKEMLLVAWNTDGDRVKMGKDCLKTYKSLLADDGKMMSMFGRQPNDSDKLFIRQSTFRFKASQKEVEAYMKKVSELLHQGETLGNPTRERVIEVLEECGTVVRDAHKKMRDEYWKIKDAELKEEYRRNKERQAEEQAKAAA